MALTAKQKADYEYIQNAVRDALIAAHKARGIDVRVTKNRCSIGIGEASFSITAVLEDATSQAEKYASDTKWTNLMHVPFGTVVRLQGAEFKVIGYNPRKRKQPVVIERVSDQKTFVCSDDVILAQHPLPLRTTPTPVKLED